MPREKPTDNKAKQTKRTSESKPKKEAPTEDQLPFEDDNYFELNSYGPRYCSKSVFKGTTYLNIREYYLDGDKYKPGKKGISLKKEEFDLIVKHLREIKQWFGEESSEEEEKEKKENEENSQEE